MTAWLPRNALGMVLAPAAPVLLFFVFFGVLALWDPSVFANDAGSFLGWVALVSYAGFALLGVPAILVLRWSGLLKLWTLLVASAILGTVTLCIFQVALFWPFSSMSLWMIGHLALWGVPAGLGVAFAYWLIAFMRHNNTVERDGPQAARPSL